MPLPRAATVNCSMIVGDRLFTRPPPSTDLKLGYQCQILTTSRSLVRAATSTPREIKAGGAGEGNRTLVRSLGSSCSAIELHPHAADDKRSAAACKRFTLLYDPFGRAAGGSTGTVPISEGRHTSRISRSSEVAISL
jgi:hypothetical protein